MKIEFDLAVADLTEGEKIAISKTLTDEQVKQLVKERNFYVGDITEVLNTIDKNIIINYLLNNCDFSLILKELEDDAIIQYLKDNGYYVFDDLNNVLDDISTYDIEDWIKDNYSLDDLICWNI